MSGFWLVHKNKCSRGQQVSVAVTCATRIRARQTPTCKIYAAHLPGKRIMTVWGGLLLRYTPSLSPAGAAAGHTLLQGRHQSSYKPMPALLLYAYHVRVERTYCTVLRPRAQPIGIPPCVTERVIRSLTLSNKTDINIIPTTRSKSGFFCRRSATPLSRD